MKNFFKVIHNSPESKARLGAISTENGAIKTPAFVAVGTKGTVKALTPDLVKSIGTQAAFVNTYHLMTHPGAEIIERAGGIHKYSGLNMPLMSDSGGFQVFSLARTKTSQNNFYHTRVSPLRDPLESEKITFASSLKETRKADVRGYEKPLLVKITDDGVKFRSTYDGKLIEFTPEKSMEYQAAIGADINMAFDECTYYPSSHDYASRAMNRTHRWLERCIDYVKSQKSKVKTTTQKLKIENLDIENSMKIENGKLKINQYLYGVIQGGTFEDLRKKSAQFVVKQNTPGVAIGGVSVGETKREMRDQVRWVSDYLPKDRPVHLLGVGQMDDIIDLVKYGIDTFDCVEPTRLARMGILYKMSNIKLQMTNKFIILNDKDLTIDITRTEYKNNLEKVDVNCNCYVCNNFSKSYIHHLFKQREILGYTLATYHNLWTMERLFEKIRELIENDEL
jgi:queuine/archaeosine tRNA-ribosyltransferase